VATYTVARVDYTSLLSQPWENIFATVDNRTNVSDPSVGSAEHRKFVYSRDADVKKAGPAKFPYIVCNLPSITHESYTADGKHCEVSWVVELEVVTSDVGANNQEGKGAEWNNRISDAIVKTFNDKTIKDTLRNTAGMAFFRPDSPGVTVEEMNNTLVFRRSFFLSCKTRMAVSA
jgi:hypothetical protein